MGDIYRNARKALVCMGKDADGGAEDVAGLVHDISEMISKYNSIADMPILAADNPLFDDPRWKALATLMKCPWFTRAWVVQDVSVGNHMYSTNSV